MLVPLSWLHEFVPFTCSAQELGDKLTMLGLELEGITQPFAALSPIVVGHVLACEKHPEAEKLSVCKVDIGAEVLDIVCGAPNVRNGLKVAVATIGTTLPGGLTIKKASLRGVASHGMLCSEAELELSTAHSGIMELPDTALIGTSIIDALELEKEVLDIGITPNRSDCLSILGIAREVAIACNLPLRLPTVELIESTSATADMVRLHIDDANLCPLYAARILENAHTAPSPNWLRFRLQAVGIRAISNLVDVTNYILMELGQPLHAFDLDKVTGQQLYVQAAREKEQCTTLDGTVRELHGQDIVIRDAERTIALGGVMGGANSEVTSTTSRVLIEAAIFHPSHIRRTARRLHLHSEASYRFERGVDQKNTLYALHRAAALMAQISGGTVCKGAAVLEPKPFTPTRIPLRHERAELLLGVPMSTEFCQTTLQQLGCTLEENTTQQQTAQEWLVTPPSYRLDLVREADLIEELVRVYGVDNIPAILPAIAKPLERAGAAMPRHQFCAKIKHWAAGLGLNEAINYSFVSHNELDSLGFAADGRLNVMNPLSDEMNVLRPQLIPGLLQNLRTNIAQGKQGIRLFELATAFQADEQSETTAAETAWLGIMLFGKRFDTPWPQTQAEMDYQDLKGLLEHLAAHLHLPTLSWHSQSTIPWLAPCITLECNGKNVGFAGKVRPALADAYHAQKPVWVAEVALDTLYDIWLEQQIRFTPLPVFPPIRRDITFIAQPGVQVSDIMQAIQQCQASLLEHVSLIDFYETEQSNERHLTFRLTFRHPEKTLKDKDADKQRDIIASTVPSTLPVRV